MKKLLLSFCLILTFFNSFGQKEAEEKGVATKKISWKDSALAALNTIEPSQRRFVCSDLADTYIQNHEFEKALFYLENLEKNTPRIKCYSGKPKRGSDLKFKYAQCFAGQNRLNKAIKLLTPMAFEAAGNFHYFGRDSIEYLKIVSSYLAVLQKQYSVSRVKKELEKSLKNLVYKTKKETLRKDWTLIHIECYFYLFGEKVFIAKGYYEPGSATNGFKEAYTKESMLHTFRQNFVYKKLASPEL